MTGENPARAAARRLLALKVPDNLRKLFSDLYGVFFGSDVTYADILEAKVRSEEEVDG